MCEKQLRVQMMGGFSMYYGGSPIALKRTGSAKSVRLLQMLLLAGGRGVSKNELMDSLYGWCEKGDLANRNRNLNNLAYRLRRQLEAAGLPEGEYVSIRDGICYWSSGLPLWVDAKKFEAAALRARESRGKERFRLLLKANKSYFGELLPMNLSDTWFYERNLYYKELYGETIEALDGEYRKRKDYQGRLELYSRAASIYPFDNWQTEEIRCHMETYQYGEAMRIYNETMELYAEKLAAAPAEEMRECFEEAKRRKARKISATGDSESHRRREAQEDELVRAIFAEEKKEERGAYYCSYPSFIDYCRLVVNVKERIGFDVALVFLTLVPFEGKRRGKKNGLAAQMELLKKAVEGALRRSDAYTRYGSRHYVLMLTMTSRADCAKVFCRIEEAYGKLEGSCGELRYHTAAPQKADRAIHEG